MSLDRSFRNKQLLLVQFIHQAIYVQDVEAKREKLSDYAFLRDLNPQELKEATEAM